MNREDLFNFLAEEECGRPRVSGLDVEDVNNDISVGVYSGFGGAHCHSIKLSLVPNWLESIERIINRDFYLKKYNNE